MVFTIGFGEEGLRRFVRQRLGHGEGKVLLNFEIVSLYREQKEAAVILLLVLLLKTEMRMKSLLWWL